MEAPRLALLLSVVTDNELASTIARLRTRKGAAALLRLLGFHEPLGPRHAPSRCRHPARYVFTTAQGSLRGHHVVLRGDCTVSAASDLLRAFRLEDAFRHHLLIASGSGNTAIVACNAFDQGVRYAVFEVSHIRNSDVDLLRDLIATDGSSGAEVAARIMQALSPRRLTNRFFRDIRSTRSAISSAWTGLPHNATGDRDTLALLLLSRLMFLYFLQRRGLLNHDADYLPRQLRSWQAAPRVSFFRRVLCTLFFGVLNRTPDRRTARALALGTLPYLNGGLFEQHHIESRWPQLDIPDDTVAQVFAGLLDKYRFTSGEDPISNPDESIGSGIDPEMLGRIFEGLMPGDQRGRTGTFYTPASAVDDLVVDALAEHVSRCSGLSYDMVRVVVSDKDAAPPALVREVAVHTRSVRVLDPACGSGAFLLGALRRLNALRTRDVDAADVATRYEIVAHSLHGVDLLEDAALICALRLWLSLLPTCGRVEDVPPLPNLDTRIRQGDALIDPLQIGAGYAGRPLSGTAPPNLRRLLTRLQPLSDRYMMATPQTKPHVRRELRRLEMSLARAWLSAIEQELQYDAQDLAARAAERDLFGNATSEALAASQKLVTTERRLEELRSSMHYVVDSRALPFFSFRVHFANASDGFDLILSNPPWIRSHSWPPALRTLLRQHYQVCARAGWPYAADLTCMPGAAGAQVDLALLFLERSIALLRPSGTLGMLLPAKLLRSLAPGGARALLLESTSIGKIDDHSLDQRTVFDADAFTTTIVASRNCVQDDGDQAFEAVTDGGRDCIRVKMTRRGAQPLLFQVSARDLPLREGDTRSPWLLAPPNCVAAFRNMQRAGLEIGRSGLQARRGVMTAANDVLIVQHVEPKIGDLAFVRAEGFGRKSQHRKSSEYAGLVEASAVRPILRGADVREWQVTVRRHVLWVPANDTAGAATPRRVAQYLARHRAALRRGTHAAGALQRLSPGLYGHKVVWADIASDLRAAMVPDVYRTALGTSVPLIPLNTAYFIATTGQRDALLLVAYLNSLPLRTFARAIAERAKDAHFRFFAWTVAALPLPLAWRHGAIADRLVALSCKAHAEGGMSPGDRDILDGSVCEAFGISAAQRSAIADFDYWLGGGAV